MNRKLLNGLLVAAIAAGGVGTFTSCKDEDFRNDVQLEQDSLAAKLEAIRGVDDAAFKAALEDWANNWLDGKTKDFSSYEDMVAKTKSMYELYDMVMKGQLPADFEKLFADTLYQWMVNKGLATEEYVGQQLEPIEERLDSIENILKNLGFDFTQINRPTSVGLTRVFNPVFGTINLPVGINTTVLATYEYKADYLTGNPYNFPADAYLNLNESSPFRDDKNEAQHALFMQVTQAIKNLCPANPNNLLPSGREFTTVTDETFGNMGGAVLSINPTINDFKGKYVVELVKSNGENPFSTVDKSLELVEEFNDELYFGASRAEGASDLYALKVNASDKNFEGLYLDVDKSDLKDAVKQAWEEKSISSVAHLGEVVFRTVNNKLPAYAVKVSWNEGTNDDPVWNSVYSNYDLAATVVHPLSYGTMISKVIPEGKQLPFFGPLEDYIDRIQNKLTLDLPDLNGIDPIELNLTIKLENNYVIFTYTNEDGMTETMCLPYNLGEIQATEDQLQEFVNNILTAINKELGGDLNYKIVKQLNDAIADINDQLKEFQGKVGDFNNYLEDIKNSKKLTYADKLVDIYNRLATYANKFLSNPNHYLQVMMAYSAGNGPHHMSPRWYDPTVVDASLGNGFEVYVSSHTGDVVVPSYKKYVAITGVVNADGSVDVPSDLKVLNENAGLNRILPGTQERMAINIKALQNKTVRLTYVSVDYRGQCSMENYFLRVK